MGGVFNAQGPVAGAEGHLIITAVLIMLAVAVPLLIALYVIMWRYRAGAHDDTSRAAAYEPEHTGSAPKQLLWWAIPAVVIAIISILDWRTTHALDPVKPLAVSSAPQTLEIQVIALPWKWLFLYPSQDIATVNYLEFPAGAPVHFDLTADAPMSSFWIPELGSQIYAMAAMQTQLNLMASSTGVFEGKDTEINGAGYAGMTFKAHAVTQAQFDAWIAQVKAPATMLTMDDYNALAAPSSYAPTSSYSVVVPGLYGYVLMKYMTPPQSSTMQMPGGMNM